jgi:hypothetical protein
MSLRHRPSRSALSRHWLDYLDALQDELLAASSQDALALRLEITIAENELVRRGLPPHALELVVCEEGCFALSAPPMRLLPPWVERAAQSKSGHKDAGARPG